MASYWRWLLNAVKRFNEALTLFDDFMERELSGGVFVNYL